MGLAEVIKQRRRGLSAKVASTAEDVIPGFLSGGVGAEYRVRLFESYQDQEAFPKRDNNGRGQLRSPNEARLDRAWDDVIKAMDRQEGTIRAGVFRDIYDDGAGEYETRTARLRKDFDEILDRVDTEE